MNTGVGTPEKIWLTIDHYATGAPLYYLTHNAHRKRMPSQGVNVILLLILATLFKTTEAFGGRRKHVAHIFGKRADYDISNARTHGRTLGFGGKPLGLNDIDYYTNQDKTQQNMVFPTDENVQRSLDYLNHGESNIKDISGLFDSPNNDNEQDYPEDNFRQKFFDMYIFDRFPRYKK